MASTTKKRLRRAAKRNERERRAATARPLGPPPGGDVRRDPPSGPDDLDGGAGVREPRRPRPNAPAGYLELDEPEPTFLELAR